MRKEIHSLNRCHGGIKEWALEDSNANHAEDGD